MVDGQWRDSLQGTSQGAITVSPRASVVPVGVCFDRIDSDVCACVTRSDWISLRLGKSIRQAIDVISKKSERAPDQEGLVSEEHPELFHYTSLSSLEGILGTNTLWATHALHLNDSSEMKLLFPKIEAQFAVDLKEAFGVGLGGQPEMLDEAEKYGGIEEIAKRDGSMIVQVMKSLMFGDSTSPGMGIPFITSFAIHKEKYYRQNGMLSQWRGYGCHEPIALVFDTLQLESLLTSECQLFEYSSWAIASAVYYEENLELKKCFPSLYQAIKNVSGDVALGFGDKEKSLKNFQKLIPKILIAVARLKHQAFSEEEECRIIVGVLHEGHGERIAELGQSRCLKTILHRPGPFGSIPYIELFRDLSEPLPIKRILIGPSINQVAHLESVKELVNRLAGDRSIELEKSEIPYVSTA